MAFGEIVGETPEHRLIRICHIACVWTEVKFCGVRDGLCYFEWYNEEMGNNEEDTVEDCPSVLLSVPAPDNGLVGQTAVDQLINQIVAQIG